MTLCGADGCRLIQGHVGRHDCYPTSAWSFLKEVDRRKIEKAGYATPRGGSKGAYQNHVVRSNRVIIPYERLNQVDLEKFKDGYIVRLLPDQYFSAANTVKVEFTGGDSQVQLGVNAFVLYRSHQSITDFPLQAGWSARHLTRAGELVSSRRGKDIEEAGEYVVRAPKLGTKVAKKEGSVQGIFAPEYAARETNYLCRCLLAWLIVRTVDSRYATSEADHIRSILTAEGLFNEDAWDYKGVQRKGFTACPLCTRLIHYGELHSMLSLEDEDALANAGIQIEGATRSTIVNLFHLLPLNYSTLDHVPGSVAWGHAICNTKLGQRRCYSLEELREEGLKVAVLNGDEVETFGWISKSWEIIRSPLGSVWIRISSDRLEE